MARLIAAYVAKVLDGSQRPTLCGGGQWKAALAA